MSFGLSAGTLLAGGAMAGGAYMQSKAAGDAVDAQTAAANQANETQRYMYDTTRKDNAPFLANGTAASNRLAYMLGLSPASNGVGGPVTSAPSRDQYLAPDAVTQAYRDLLGRNPEAGGYEYYKNRLANGWTVEQLRNDIANSREAKSLTSPPHYQLTPEEQAAADQRYQEAQTQYAATQADPAFGSLTRRFSLDDLNNDPVYQTGLQFGLDEGNKGIERQAAASGQMLSGATLKALSKYATDYAGTKANESYNRFTNDQTNTYNRLAGVAGSGQQANSLVASAGTNTSNNISQNQIGVGNARAASSIGSANAWSNALGQGVNMYQQNQLMNKLFPGTTG